MFLNRKSHHLLTVLATAGIALAMALVFLPSVSGTAEGSAYRSSGNQGDVSRLQSKVWYLAEGYTAGDFDTWVLVQNPGDEDVDVTMEFQLPEGASAEPYAFTLPANTRESVLLDDLPGLAATEVSTTVTSTSDIYVQRSMYFDYREARGGTGTFGSVCPDFDWYFAEGYTGGLFDTFILVQNPGGSAAQVTMDFHLPAGVSAEPHTLEVPPFSRRTVKLNDLPGLGSTDVSTRVTATEPVVAERAMYWGEMTPLGQACHGTIGMTDTHNTFYFPDGQTSDGRETYTLVQNPNSGPVEVQISCLSTEGKIEVTFTEVIPGGSRRTYPLADMIEENRASTIVECKTPGKRVGTTAAPAPAPSAASRTDPSKRAKGARPHCVIKRANGARHHWRVFRRWCLVALLHFGCIACKMGAWDDHIEPSSQMLYTP
ncbi:MAG: hypothetical protein KJ920_04075 [Actinobacteria bacterium]|nr:hypothetical protein [Actinomycetota bacterium]